MLNQKTFATLLASLLAVCTIPAGAQDSAETKTKETARDAEHARSVSSEAARSPRGPLPDDVEGLRKTAAEAYEAGDGLRFIQANMRLRKLRPYEPEYLVGMVVGAAMVNRPTTAYNYMHVMQRQGLSHDFNSAPETESIRGTEVYDYLNDLLVRANSPGGEAEVAFELKKSDKYPEAIAWDESRRAFLVATVDSGTVIAVSKDEKARELIHATSKNGLKSLHGLAVDAERKRLWLSSNNVSGAAQIEKEKAGSSALFELDLKSLEVLNRYDVPTDGMLHFLAGIAVAPSGDVYVVDRATPIIYTKRMADPGLAPFVGNPEMVGFRDMTLSQDGTKMYVADAAEGILLIDLAAQSSQMLSVPETLNLAGISGLIHHGNSLFLIQNGITPQRLLRLDLDATGSQVEAQQGLAVALDSFNAPSFGAVYDDSIYYFASGNLPGVNKGKVRPVILKSPLALEEDIVTADMRKFNEDNESKIDKVREVNTRESGEKQ